MAMLLPLIMFVAFIGLNSTAAYFSSELSRPPAAVTASIPAQNFIEYKSAVLNFVTANSVFTGSIPLQSLQQYMPGVTATAMVGMSNSIIPGYGNSSKLIAISASAAVLAPGTSASVISMAQYDASVGMVRGGQWTSYTAPSNPISVPLPDNSLTYLITIN